MTTETEPVPNPVAGDSERVACKSKKGKGFWKPNTELLPNRNSELQVAALAEWPLRGSIVGHTDELNQGVEQGIFYVCDCINNALTTRHPVPFAA